MRDPAVVVRVEDLVGEVQEFVLACVCNVILKFKDAASLTEHAELRDALHRLAEIHARPVPGLAQQLEGRVHELRVAEAEVVEHLLRGHLRGASRRRPPDDHVDSRGITMSRDDAIDA